MELGARGRGLERPSKHGVRMCVQLRVAPSQSKHKLYIGNIPRELSKEGFKEQLDAVVRGAAFPAWPTCPR